MISQNIPDPQTDINLILDRSYTCIQMPCLESAIGLTY